MEKQISIVVAASGEIKDIAISPGATVREILDEAGLQGYQLSKKGGEPLDPDTDIFDATTDSEKLDATPEDVSVGSGGSASASKPSFLKNAIINFIRVVCPRLLYKYEKWCYAGVKRVRIIGVRSFKLSHRSKKAQFRRKRKYKRKQTKIVRKNREYPYWKENGWQKRQDTYRGYYKTSYGMWRGMVKENYKSRYSFYIFYPPEALRDHKHWQCFSYKGNGKHAIHFSRKPRDISSGIITVEQLLREAIEQNRKGGQRCFLDVPNLNIREYVLNQLRRI